MTNARDQLLKNFRHHYVWYKTYVAQEEAVVTIASAQGFVAGILQSLRMIDRDAYNKAREIMREVDKEFEEN